MARTTVVIASRNRSSSLLRTLSHLSELAVPVVLVDNASTDDTVSRVRDEFPHVLLLESAVNRGAVARNLGVRAARTPFVAFADDDSWWAPDALERAEPIFDEHPDLAVIAARTLVGPSGRPDPITPLLRDSPLGEGVAGPAVLGFMACSAIVRRQAFLDVGGFSPVLFFRGEETLLSWDLAAAGWALCYVEDVVAHHHPAPVGRASGEDVVERRNAVLTTWMRRPVSSALAASLKDPRAFRAALPLLGQALRQRRELPEHLEAQIRKLTARPRRGA
ncbi:Glycosyltransferase, GT2 family [Lentzea xinjiangensis]|uniref:Glycosyltransferase, GT2 family n=1 Tax=Lentzea xinjiangensis TaxID=402600 RepID=A0A1H9UNX5_9PSEU|nr:glycosyltransferase [Lentzea xinjiangensis]SES11220.1 Glycosyltransferase, GT2 family [Lentzea xinjiangensis]